MPVALIVDDVEMDRVLVGRLLEKEGTFSPVYASGGTEALAEIDRSPPDIVVTDLYMPNMDGLELVENIRRDYPLIPVVLVTSKGNEEIAVQALRRGAASYVPKRFLATDLVDTLSGILTISGKQRDRSRLAQYMVFHRYQYVLDSNPEALGPVLGQFQDVMERLNLFDETERIQVSVALEEVLVNALHHGNLELKSALKEEDPKAYFRQLEERRQSDPYQKRRIFVEASFAPEEARFIVRDEGPGFDPSSIPDPTDPTNLGKMSGRGLLLMKTFMSEVNFNQTGNEVTLIKRANSGDEST